MPREKWTQIIVNDFRSFLSVQLVTHLSIFLRERETRRKGGMGRGETEREEVEWIRGRKGKLHCSVFLSVCLCEFLCLPLSVFVSLSLCLSLCVCLSFCLPLFHFVSLCLSFLSYCFWLCLCVCPYFSVSVFASLFLTLSVHCLCLFVSLPPSLSLILPPLPPPPPPPLPPLSHFVYVSVSLCLPFSILLSLTLFLCLCLSLSLTPSPSFTLPSLPACLLFLLQLYSEIITPPCCSGP